MSTMLSENEVSSDVNYVSTTNVATKALRIVLQHWLIPDMEWNPDVFESHLPILREAITRDRAEALRRSGKREEEITHITKEIQDRLSVTIVDDDIVKTRFHSTVDFDLFCDALSEVSVESLLPNVTFTDAEIPESMRFPFGGGDGGIYYKRESLHEIANSLYQTYWYPLSRMIEYDCICVLLTRIKPKIQEMLVKVTQFFQLQQERYSQRGQASLLIYQLIALRQLKQGILQQMQRLFFTLSLFPSLFELDRKQCKLFQQIFVSSEDAFHRDLMMAFEFHINIVALKDFLLQSMNCRVDTYNQIFDMLNEILNLVSWIVSKCCTKGQQEITATSHSMYNHFNQVMELTWSIHKYILCWSKIQVVDVETNDTMGTKLTAQQLVNRQYRYDHTLFLSLAHIHAHSELEMGAKASAYETIAIMLAEMYIVVCGKNEEYKANESYMQMVNQTVNVAYKILAMNQTISTCRKHKQLFLVYQSLVSTVSKYMQHLRLLDGYEERVNKHDEYTSDWMKEANLRRCEGVKQKLIVLEEGIEIAQKAVSVMERVIGRHTSSSSDSTNSLISFVEDTLNRFYQRTIKVCNSYLPSLDTIDERFDPLIVYRKALECGEYSLNIIAMSTFDDNTVAKPEESHAQLTQGQIYQLAVIIYDSLLNVEPLHEQSRIEGFANETMNQLHALKALTTGDVHFTNWKIRIIRMRLLAIAAAIKLSMFEPCSKHHAIDNDDSFDDFGGIIRDECEKVERLEKVVVYIGSRFTKVMSYVLTNCWTNNMIVGVPFNGDVNDPLTKIDSVVSVEETMTLWQVLSSHFGEVDNALENIVMRKYDMPLVMFQDREGSEVASFAAVQFEMEKVCNDTILRDACDDCFVFITEFSRAANILSSLLQEPVDELSNRLRILQAGRVELDKELYQAIFWSKS